MKKLLSLFLSLVLVVSMMTITQTKAETETTGETTTQENINITVTAPGEYVEESNTIYFNSINSSGMQKVYISADDETDVDAEYRFFVYDTNIAMIGSDDKGTYIYINKYTPNAEGEGITEIEIQKKEQDAWQTVKSVSLVVCDTPTYSVRVSKTIYKGETFTLDEFKGGCIDNEEIHNLALNPKYFLCGSSNHGIATIDNKGVVKGIKSGTTTVTVSYNDEYCYDDGTEAQSTGFIFDITVLDRIEELSFEKDEYTLQKGDVVTILPTVVSDVSNSNNRSYTFESSNEDIATVDDSGNVRACGVGKTTITATSTDGGNVSASYNLLVTSSKVKNLVAVGTVSGVKLVWDMDTDAEEYYIYKRIAGETEFTLCNKSMTNSFVDAQTVVGQTYEYYIVVIAKQGETYNSPASEIVRGQKTSTSVEESSSVATSDNGNKENTTSSIKKPSISKVKVKKKSAKITIKGTKYTGFAVYVGKNKKPTKLYKRTKTKTITVKVKKKGTYYVRVRAYKTVNGKTTYSKYSTAKKFKIK